jgi:hypothetical protein
MAGSFFNYRPPPVPDGGQDKLGLLLLLLVIVHVKNPGHVDAGNRPKAGSRMVYSSLPHVFHYSQVFNSSQLERVEKHSFRP